jgi:hypothetical protein
MSENINTDTAIVKADIGNLVVDDPVLTKYAAEIRRLGKRVKEDVVEIGRYLDQAQKHAGHGTWLAWIEAEFGWSDQTAYHFIHLYQAYQNPEFQNFWNSDLPMSALYRLAAPNTPQEARDEVAERIEAGEKVSVAAAAEAIAKAKGKAKAPKPTRDKSSATNAPGAVSKQTRRAAAPSDEALLGFTACVLDLKRRIGKHGPLRFAKTSVAGSDLVWLGEFLRALAQCKGCEPAQASKRSKPDKPYKHTLTLEANSTRNKRGNRSRH